MNGHSFLYSAFHKIWQLARIASIHPIGVEIGQPSSLNRTNLLLATLSAHVPSGHLIRLQFDGEPVSTPVLWLPWII